MNVHLYYGTSARAVPSCGGFLRIFCRARLGAAAACSVVIGGRRKNKLRPFGDLVRNHIVPADERSGTDRDYKTGRTNTERIKRELEKVKIHEAKGLKEESLDRRINREAEAAAK